MAGLESTARQASALLISADGEKRNAIDQCNGNNIYILDMYNLERR